MAENSNKIININQIIQSFFPRYRSDAKESISREDGEKMAEELVKDFREDLKKIRESESANGASGK